MDSTEVPQEEQLTEEMVFGSMLKSYLTLLQRWAPQMCHRKSNRWRR